MKESNHQLLITSQLLYHLTNQALADSNGIEPSPFPVARFSRSLCDHHATIRDFYSHSVMGINCCVCPFEVTMITFDTQSLE